MKKIRVIAAMAFIATALQLSCSASVLFNIRTVYSSNEYASITGRSLEEVMQTVESSAKEQLQNSNVNFAPAIPVVPVVPVTPVIPTTPAEVVASTSSFADRVNNLNPSAVGALSGADVTITYVNGVPMLNFK